MKLAVLLLAASVVYAQSTPNLNLNVPATGTLNWGTLLNANAYTVDQLATGYQSGWLIWPLTTKGDLYTYCNGPSRLPATTNGFFLTLDSTQPCGMKWAAGSGTGTVTNFTSGNLSPLFTTSVANSSSTPALSFTLSSQTANQFFAAPNGVNGSPLFRNIVAADIPTLNQNTTGTAANVTGIVAVANGGTGTATPSLVAGTNISITGTWPNQTITASGSGSSGVASLTTGASGALSCTGTGTPATGPVTCDVVTSVVPLKASANVMTGLNTMSQLRLAITTYSALPVTCSSGTDGQLAYISDSTTQTWGAAVTTGGGTSRAFIVCDGSAGNWTVFGK